MDTVEVVEQARVLSGGVLTTADFLGMSDPGLAATLGIPEAAVHYLRSGALFLEVGTKPAALGLLLIRLFRSLDVIVGGTEHRLNSG